MTFQKRDSLIYRGQKRTIWGLPFEPYFNQGRPSPFVAPGSNCWRGYVSTWEIRDDALDLIAIDGTGHGYKKIGLDELFPGRPGSVEATWFSGEITPDDAVSPDDRFLVEMHRANNLPLHFLWFDLVIHHGKLLLEESTDLQTGTIETRLTRHAEQVFPDSELGFVQAICSNLDDSAAKAIYADWLEERGDRRCELLRAEAARLTKEGPRRRAPPAERRRRQDIATGFVDPEDLLWYWRRLADVPELTPEDRSYRQLLGELGLADR